MASSVANRRRISHAIGSVVDFSAGSEGDISVLYREVRKVIKESIGKCSLTVEAQHVSNNVGLLKTLSHSRPPVESS